MMKFLKFPEDLFHGSEKAIAALKHALRLDS
jgi:hypothetical protein